MVTAQLPCLLCVTGKGSICVALVKLHSPSVPPEKGNDKPLFGNSYLEKRGKGHLQSELTQWHVMIFIFYCLELFISTKITVEGLKWRNPKIWLTVVVTIRSSIKLRPNVKVSDLMSHT